MFINTYLSTQLAADRQRELIARRRAASPRRPVPRPAAGSTPHSLGQGSGLRRALTRSPVRGTELPA